MKAIKNINRISKVFTLVGFFSFITLYTYGQGLLIESAAKLFSNNKTEQYNIETPVSFATYAIESDAKNDSFSLRSIADLFASRENGNDNRNNSPVVLQSFKVSDVNIFIEKEIETERWMKKSFTNEFENELTTEAWMNESISESFEEYLAYENWMSELIYDIALEGDVEVEEWMTTAFEMNNESELVVENWMEAPLSNSFEEEIELEKWMISLF